MKVIVCLCGLLRLVDEPCVICEGDDLDFDTFILDGLRGEAGDEDDTKRRQLESVLAMEGRRH